MAEVKECTGEIAVTLQIEGSTLAEMYGALADYLAANNEFLFAETHTVFDIDLPQRFYVIARLT